MFEFAEETLDQIALPIEAWIDAALDAPVALCGDVSPPALALDKRDKLLPVIGAVSHEIADGGQALDQARRGCFIGGMALGEQQPNRQAMCIDDSVELGGQSSTRTADGVILAPFLPPAAC